MIRLNKNTWFLVIAMLTLLSAQNAFAWGTSPSSGSSSSLNGWGSDLVLEFDGPHVEALFASDPESLLQIELLTGPVDGVTGDDTCTSFPCLWAHGNVVACVDETGATDGGPDGQCDAYGSEVTVLANMNMTIDPLTEQGGEYTASGKQTNIEGYLTCIDVLDPANPGSPLAGASCETVTGFDVGPTTELGLPKGGNYNKVFPATDKLEAGQLLSLIGYPENPKPVMRHCYEQGIAQADVDGVADCGTKGNPHTADAEILPFIGGLLFESTTTNLNIGKNADSYSIHVNLLSQTSPDGLAFIPEDIDITKSLAIEGTCEPVLGQVTSGDYNGDGVTDWRLKYDAGCVDGLPKVTSTPDGSSVDLNIRGTLLDGTQFQGSFTVTVNQ